MKAIISAEIKGSDTPENRIAIFKLYEQFLQSDNFKNTFEMLSGAKRVDSKEVVKAWVMRANWMDIKTVRINKMGNYITYQNNYKNGRYSVWI